MATNANFFDNVPSSVRTASELILNHARNYTIDTARTDDLIRETVGVLRVLDVDLEHSVGTGGHIIEFPDPRVTPALIETRRDVDSAVTYRLTLGVDGFDTARYFPSIDTLMPTLIAMACYANIRPDPTIQSTGATSRSWVQTPDTPCRSDRGLKTTTRKETNPTATNANFFDNLEPQHRVRFIDGSGKDHFDMAVPPRRDDGDVTYRVLIKTEDPHGTAERRYRSVEDCMRAFAAFVYWAKTYPGQLPEWYDIDPLVNWRPALDEEDN